MGAACQQIQIITLNVQILWVFIGAASFLVLPSVRLATATNEAGEGPAWGQCRAPDTASGLRSGKNRLIRPKSRNGLR